MPLPLAAFAIRKFSFTLFLIFTFNLLKRFRVAFSFMCDGKDFFIDFVAA